MLHGQTINHNSPSPPSTRHETLTAYARDFREANLTVFENAEAKAAVRDRNQDQLWVQSNEMNSAAFDLKQLSVLPADFYEALVNQYPSAIEAVPVRQEAINGVIIAFDSAESRITACNIGIAVGSFTVIGTPTLLPTSSIYQVSLEKLPLMRSDSLTPLLTETFSRYGTVLHAGLYRDPVSRLFFGKGSMAPHCFNCHKPGYTRGNCPRLSQQCVKTCYSCGDPGHLIRECPKRNTATVGEKRTCYDDSLPTIPTSSSSLNLGSSSAQNSSSSTPIVFAVSRSVYQSGIESSMTANIQKNIVRTGSKASTTIITAVIPEEDDDAYDTDYVPSDGQSESDESEHDSDVMSIDSQERQDIEDDAHLLQSNSTPGAVPQSDGEAAHSSSTHRLWEIPHVSL
ncbi:hypothetical protein BCV72DRAFT_257278 [Rhizopus microsporus var. microsporus]|uniref:CCHC-type domain-containing protein n=1 Tax=Rhizopus microsporus var. microsporus TaxID=86635 RepID=A0A1X0QXM1_RHIZD|nr:hypothetical protein BCV72DRAFT_257278 [Rhizopus microsporus var. microsporus]